MHALPVEMKKEGWPRQKKSAKRLHECGRLHQLQRRVPADILSELLYQISNRVNALRVFDSSNLTLFIGWVSPRLFTDLFLCLLLLEVQVTDVTWIC